MCMDERGEDQLRNRSSAIEEESFIEMSTKNLMKVEKRFTVDALITLPPTRTPAHNNGSSTEASRCLKAGNNHHHHHHHHHHDDGVNNNINEFSRTRTRRSSTLWAPAIRYTIFMASNVRRSASLLVLVLMLLLAVKAVKAENFSGNNVTTTMPATIIMVAMNSSPNTTTTTTTKTTTMHSINTSKPIKIILTTTSIAPASIAKTTTPSTITTTTTAALPTLTTTSEIPSLSASASLNMNTSPVKPQHSSSSSSSEWLSPVITPLFQRFTRRLSTGNELWDSVIHECYQRPTFACFQRNVYTYLRDSLDVNDINVTQHLKFYKNQVNFAYCRRSADATSAEDCSEDEESQERETRTTTDMPEDPHVMSNEIPRHGRAAFDEAVESPIEEVTGALYGRSVQFAMNHDMEIQLPELVFDGASLRISPRSLEGNGVVAKLELIPRAEVEARLAGKILMKRIQKFLRSKLLLSFLALVLIIKIIKIKFFWLLPLIVGVTAAKKLLLKFLLFLFPALSHLFKLCSYYQQTYHSTKYHHHHHLINHHHTIVPPWHEDHHHQGPELIYTSLHRGSPASYGPENLHSSHHENYDAGWENSGPGLGSEYISDINRVAQVDTNTNYFKPDANDANELKSWGLGGGGGVGVGGGGHAHPHSHQQQYRTPTTQHQKLAPIKRHKPHLTSHSSNPLYGTDAHSVYASNGKITGNQQSTKDPLQYTALRSPLAGGGASLTAAQFVAQYDATRKHSQQQQQHVKQLPELTTQLKEAARIQAEQRIVAQQQKILEKQPFAQDGQIIMPMHYDPFYSPILLKVDKVLEQLGVTDDACKEQLVCNMYRDPSRYTPHSNFVSAELSRDTSELEPVTNANRAVLRFYQLIEAARVGQDHKDCSAVYKQCTVMPRR